jgi:hypothetical protein
MSFYFVPTPEVYDNSDYPFWSYHSWDAAPQLSNTNHILQPTIRLGSFTPTRQIIPTQHSGYALMSLYDDVYGYVHVEPTYFNVGTLLADQTHTIEIWNADFYNTVTLNSLGLVNTEGIQFEGPLSYPYTFGINQAEEYRIKVTMSGPPVINATISLNFDAYSIPIRIEGRRLVVFYWMPKKDFTEKLEWLTDLIETYSDEQRIALRIAPRRHITYSYAKTPHYGSEMATLAKAWVFRTWGVPIWAEAEKIASISSGVTTISFDTRYASYTNAAFIWESDDKNEAVNIVTLRDNGIDIDQPVKHNYSNALIMPLLFGIMQDGLHMKKDYAVVQASATFTIVDDKYVGAQNYPTLDGYPILRDVGVKVEEFNERIYRASEFIDNGQGLIEVEPNRSIIEKTSLLGKVTANKVDLWRWRQFLHWLSGRQKTFLLPTFMQDIKLIEMLGSGATSAKIKGLGLSNYGTFPMRSAITFSDGSIQYRKIMSALPIPDSDDEYIVIDQGFTVNVYPEDIKRWEIINLMRLDTDEVTLEYNGLIVKCSIPVRSVNS